MAKRQRVDNGLTLPSSAVSLTCTARCLLPLLQPVRRCLHPFLSDTEAARLMQTSRSTATNLLHGYGFVDHVFTFRTAANMKRAVAFYSRYDVRILRVLLSGDWNEPLIDSETGRPLLPASLLALTLGERFGPASRRTTRGLAAYASFDGREGSVGEGQSDEKKAASESDDLGEFARRIQPVNTSTLREPPWNVFRYDDCFVAVHHPIPPSALPHGLRFLHLNTNFNQPLQAGSIPDTVEVLQIGEAFNQPLAAGHLPASLTHLVFGCWYNQPFLPGVLPAGLRRLRLGLWYNQPMQLDVLPPQLQQLSFCGEYNQPLNSGAIPPSVTHLRLSHSFNQPLEAGSIPHGVVHLNLGFCYNQPLLPGVLPSSLRELAISARFTQLLQPGSLPDRLEVLSFHRDSVYSRTLLPGVIPASVIALSLGDDDKVKLVAGGIPSTVKWLRLSRRYASGRRDREKLSSVLSASTRVVWL